MATAAEAAREFATGPQVVQAARRLLERFDIAVLCEALGNANPEDAECFIDAFEKLVQFDEVCASFANDLTLQAFLRQGSGAQDARIRNLVVRLLVRLARDDASVAQLGNAGLFAACEDLLMDPETGTAEVAAKVFCCAARWPKGREMICGTGADGGTIQRLQERLDSLSDVERIRVLHLFVDLGRTAEDCFSRLEERGAFQQVIGAFLTEDILLKLNAVELMDALGSFQAGQEFLTRQGVPERLARELMDPMNDASVRVCVVRLLGFVMLRSPQALSIVLPGRESPFAHALAEFLESRDPTEKLCALNAWSNISAHADGLAFFLQWSDIVQAVIALVAAPQMEVCKGAMTCWTCVLGNQQPPEAGAMEVDGSIAQLWSIACERLLPLVLKNLTAKPFPEVRTHTWRLLATMSRSNQIARRELTSEEMRDMLFDFTSETSSEARIAKHEFVATLTKHHGSWLGSFLNEDVEKILEEYARQGPHWAPREAAATVADQSG
mmetsp:Transcript_90557/g.255654  ORF Transcript_90557/g.255654 Transcript_90557/m.255654 type:complete len:498 (+) Transcript_90557:93-1586(+)